MRRVKALDSRLASRIILLQNMVRACRLARNSGLMSWRNGGAALGSGIYLLY